MKKLKISSLVLIKTVRHILIVHHYVSKKPSIYFLIGVIISFVISFVFYAESAGRPAIRISAREYVKYPDLRSVQQLLRSGFSSTENNSMNKQRAGGRKDGYACISGLSDICERPWRGAMRSFIHTCLWTSGHSHKYALFRFRDRAHGHGGSSCIPGGPGFAERVTDR